MHSYQRKKIDMIVSKIIIVAIWLQQSSCIISSIYFKIYCWMYYKSARILTAIYIKDSIFIWILLYFVDLEKA